MKKSLLAIALLVASIGASAQTVATAPMKNGQLRLTVIDCPLTKLSDAKDRFMAYVRLGDGKLLHGCWDEVDSQIRVTYMDNDTRFYDMRVFTLTDLGEEVQAAGKKNQPNRKPKLGETL